jgi:hypothetical protein
MSPKRACEKRGFGQDDDLAGNKGIRIDQKVADVITLDGVKVVFESGDWFLIVCPALNTVARLSRKLPT